MAAVEDDDDEEERGTRDRRQVLQSPLRESIELLLVGTSPTAAFVSNHRATPSQPITTKEFLATSILPHTPDW